MEHPSWKDLQDFLTGRARARETLELSRDDTTGSSAPATSGRPPVASRPPPSSVRAPVRPPPAPAGRAYYASEQLPPNYKDGLCDMCGKRHYITECPEFLGLSVFDRRKVAVQHRLCYNCLGRHGAMNCRRLQLSDPDFLIPGPIDIILGADVFGRLLLPEMVKADQASPIGLTTIFGWVFLGPLVTGSPHGEKVALHGTADHELHELLTKFWIQEEVPSKPSQALTPEEQECEAHFSRTHSRDSSGRYVVRLPLLGPRTNLGDSYETALRGLRRIQRRCTANQAFGRLYKEFLQEYEDLGHMQPASESSLGTSTIFYLPHHGVLTSKGSQPKLRVVAVHPADWDLQRILWSDPQGKTVCYQLTTVTYGTRSAPFLAARALLQLVQDEGPRYPLAVPPLLKGRYVDDILGGGDTAKEAEAVAVQLTQLCMAGGFPLQKWTSNCPELLKVLSEDGDAPHQTLDFSDITTKILGLSWQPLADHFWFSAARTFRDAVTKRTILSEVARLFDPLGFLAPLTIRAKILLQELWLEQLGWDEPLPPSTALRWTTFRTELQDLSVLHIPRWLNLTPEVRVEIHGFSDASQQALAAVVYLRISSSTSPATLSLVCAKTKVAPLKRLTIPRLELTAALLLAKLLSGYSRAFLCTGASLDGLRCRADLDQPSSLEIKGVCTE
ncbi:uncharacterized protein LOC114881477 [Osmia bicornis bicornis]|uniref:uncharacterized protein LOC114881477 n=1 Tax=Osmia bicornis bicornis TaxID=1437191 RepID=UPI001EAF6581|nr:uncharacterized protein LOC114881477 [Osmia bicornis bicornis]